MHFINFFETPFIRSNIFYFLIKLLTSDSISSYLQTLMIKITLLVILAFAVSADLLTDEVLEGEDDYHTVQTTCSFQNSIWKI